MKISVIIKMFMIVMFGSFLFLGCGSGDVETVTDPPSSGNNTPTPTAALDYYLLEKNITDSANGLLYLREHPITTDKVVHNQFENAYLKMITYHNVPSNIATKLYPYLTESVYINTECDKVWAEPETTNSLCGSFVIGYTDIGIADIESGLVAFQGEDSVNCGGEVCDVSLGLVTNSTAYKMSVSETIPLSTFKGVFTNGANGADRNNVLRTIENSAQSVTIQIDKLFRNLDPSQFAYVNSTIVEYIDELKVNDPVPFEQDGENLIKTYQGSTYQIKNVFEGNANITIRFFVTGSKIDLGW